MGNTINRRIRPNYDRSHLLLSSKTDELSFLPTQLIPHTITAQTVSQEQYEIVFEYQIDEDPDREQILDVGLKCTLGIYTKKVLKITVDFKSLEDLISKLHRTCALLTSRKQLLPKNSYKRNYDLAEEVLGEIVNQLMTAALSATEEK